MIKIISLLREKGYGKALTETIVVATPPKDKTASPAEKAGLRPGDVVLKINGSKIENAADARKAISQAVAHSTITIELQRKQQTLVIDVLVQDEPQG